MSIDIAVVPVAGRGTRLLPLTKSQPKEMLPVGTKPVVQSSTWGSMSRNWSPHFPRERLSRSTRPILGPIGIIRWSHWSYFLFWPRNGLEDVWGVGLDAFMVVPVQPSLVLDSFNF